MDGGEYLRVPVADVADADARNKIHIRLAVRTVHINALGLFNFKGKREIGSLRQMVEKMLAM
ncbi:hypothetical protein D3C87_2171700 [compost metagenome]